MSRAARLDAPGVLNHVIIRGIERRNIFLDDIDREDLLQRLSRLLPQTGTACYAWVLLPNHAHFLLRTGPVPLSRLMRRLLTGYAAGFNRRHDRLGQLFQNRFKSIVCQEEVYFKELVRYIHLNPLRADLIKDIEELNRHRYCGHCALMGERKRPWQDMDYVLKCFGTTVGLARRAYLDYLKAGLNQGRRADLTGGGLIRSLGGWMEVKKLRQIGRSHIMSDQRILGEPDFVDSMLSRADEKYERIYELKRMGFDLERMAGRAAEIYGLEKNQILLRGRQPRKVEARCLVCYWAVREAGMSLREIANRLKMSPSGVSWAVERGEAIANREGHKLIL